MSESRRILSENVGGYTAKERAVSRRMPNKARIKNDTAIKEGKKYKRVK